MHELLAVHAQRKYILHVKIVHWYSARAQMKAK
jgi:hypothetical protein